MSTAGTIALGRRKYAVGLIWQPSPSGRVAQAAREAAKEIKEPGQVYDFFAVRPGNKAGRLPQFALGQHKMGHRGGMASLAGSLANLLPGSWAGAFKIREGYVIVVVRDDLIAPDGDTLIADEPQARERLMYEINLGGVQRIYAPENWMIPGADAIPLPLLLQARAECLLRPVAISKRSLITGGVGVFVLLAAAFAGLSYQQELERREAEVRAQQEAIERARQAALRGLPGALRPDLYPPPRRVWEDEPAPRQWLAACEQAMQQIVADPLGWDRTDVVCSGDGLNVNYNRERAGITRTPAGMIVEPNGERAHHSAPLVALEPRGRQELIARSEVTSYLFRHPLVMDLSTLPDDPPPPPPPDAPDLPPPPPPPWQKRSISLSFNASPSAYADQFADIPGLILYSLTWTGRSWTLEGVIYETREGGTGG